MDSRYRTVRFRDLHDQGTQCDSGRERDRELINDHATQRNWSIFPPDFGFPFAQ